MKALRIYACIALLIIAGFSCRKESSNLNFENQTSTNGTQSRLGENVIPCGTPLTVLLDEFNTDDPNTWGEVTVSNDAVNIYVTFSTDAPFKLHNMKVVIGDFEHLQTVLSVSYDHLVGPEVPDYEFQSAAGLSEYTFAIPRAQYPTCNLINVWAYIEERSIFGNVLNSGSIWASPGYQTVQSHPMTSYFEYCTQECPPTDCGQLHTQTPGGWGAEPNGNNPGTYLHQNFDQAFPNGLMVGCATGNWIHMTTAQAITNLLPTGGKAAVLNTSATDPQKIKNVLVGHLIALTLSVGFDLTDVDFGDGGTNLQQMIIADGTFQGWSVQAFLTEANRVLGGCSSNYTPQQVLETATDINENYVDGIIDNGFLVCPDEREEIAEKY